MLITVIANNEGFPGVRKARRYFPNGAEVRLEVLEQEDDPPDVKPPGNNPDAVLMPDPGKIGKKSYQMLRKDIRVKVLSDDNSEGTISRASYEKAKSAAEKSSGESAGLRLRVAELEEENAQLRAQLQQAGRPAGSAPAAGQSAGQAAAAGSKNPDLRPDQQEGAKTAATGPLQLSDELPTSGGGKRGK